METPRTPEKEIISVQYYNVIFYMISAEELIP